MEKQMDRHPLFMKIYFLAIILFTGCDFSDSHHGTNQPTVSPSATENATVQNANGHTIATRFETPTGFSRTENDATSFAHYLRNLPLYKAGKKVALYNGQLKGNQTAHAAVVNMDVGSQDLQQCADAVMRLRAEYLYEQKNYDALHFKFTNGFDAQYNKWRSGNSISVSGNNVRWTNSPASNGNYESFRTYLTTVFMYAGTASLEKELKPKNIKDIQIGDVFIKGGYPGHAVLVVDVCKNAAGDKAFMLAQSYMPAQDIQVLKNPYNATISPWYKLSETNDVLETPEWTFGVEQLKTF